MVNSTVGAQQTTHKKGQLIKLANRKVRRCIRGPKLNSNALIMFIPFNLIECLLVMRPARRQLFRHNAGVIYSEIRSSRQCFPHGSAA